MRAFSDPDWISETERFMASGSKSPSTARSEVAVRLGSDCERVD